MIKVLPILQKNNVIVYKNQITCTDIIGVQSQSSKEKAFLRKCSNHPYTRPKYNVIPVRYLVGDAIWFSDLSVTLETIHASDSNFLKDMDFYLFDSNQELLKWLAE